MCSGLRKWCFFVCLFFPIIQHNNPPWSENMMVAQCFYSVSHRNHVSVTFVLRAPSGELNHLPDLALPLTMVTQYPAGHRYLDFLSVSPQGQSTCQHPRRSPAPAWRGQAGQPGWALEQLMLFPHSSGGRRLNREPAGSVLGGGSLSGLQTDVFSFLFKFLILVICAFSEIYWFCYMCHSKTC